MLNIPILILTLLLLIFTSPTITYALPNKWCSNGKYSAAITPFPKPNFNKCPAYARVIMSLKEVEEYYLDGIGQEYLCKLVENPLFFAPTSTHKTESHRIIKKLFVNKQIRVAEKCNVLRSQKSKKMNISNTVSSKGEMTYSCEENLSKNYRAYKWKFDIQFSKNSFNGKHVFYRPALKRDLERTFNGYVDRGKLYINSEMNDVVTPKNGVSIRDIMKKNGYSINFKNQSLTKSLKQILFEGIKSEEGGRICTLKLVSLEENPNNIKQAELKKKKLEEEQQKAIAQKKAEEEAKIKALAEKLAKEEIAKQLKQKEEETKKKAEELAKQKAMAEKKAKEEARKKALAKKKAEELAKQKAMAEKKAKEEARKKALAKKKAEELAKQKALAEKKAEEEALKQKVLNEKIAKIKDEAQFIVETLKEYVTTDNNKLDILEVSELLENFDSEKQKGWSVVTIEKYEALYEYVQKDNGFVTYSSEKKSKELAAYNEEIRQLREYLTISQSSLKEFITKNLGSKNANEALKLAKKSKAILKDFDLTKAMSLKNNISTWKAMNGVKEDKKFFFKLINKKLRTNKQVAAKQVDQDKSKTKKNNNTENTISKKDKDRFAFIGMCSFTFQKALYMLRNNNSPKKENYKKHLNKVNMEYSFLSRKYNFSKTQNGKKIDGNDISPIQRKGQKLVDDYYYSAEDTFKKNKNILLIQIKKCNYEFPLVKKQSNYNQQQKRNLKVGYIYKYYTDNSCRSSGKEYCISRSEMKSYCNSITGISKIGYRGSLTFARDPYGKGNNQDFRRYAARNTGPEKFNTYLTPRPYPCWVSFYYSGTYKGTSFTNKVNQPVLTFLKTKNKILVHATKSF